MRVVQVLTTISFGDAVGNDTLALKEILIKNGFETDIYAENIDRRLSKGSVKPVDELEVSREDIIIYHLSTGTSLNYWIKRVSCRKIMIYHNITPPVFLMEYNPSGAELCQQGLEEVRMLKDTFDVVFADSEFNKSDLVEMGYSCPVRVLPILIPFEDYQKRPNQLLMKKYDDGYINIVFVGRIVPNKKQEDIIHAFYLYQKYYNDKSRLFLVGSYNGMESYYRRLSDYAELLGAENVVFTGHIKFDEILAYYRLADVFVCMSEHEGFCVPLVEAMYFDVPIIAYDFCAIKGTLGGSGLLLSGKSALECAGMIDYVTMNEEVRKEVVRKQRERLADFSHEVVGKQFLELLHRFISESDKEKL